MPAATTSTHPPTRPASAAGPYPEKEIKQRLDACPKLASLQSINKALGDLLKSEQSLTSQIAEIIRRDPSLSARLLRMVNSVYFGLSAQINSIEEAVLFLGLRQIRELSMATPVIEELERLQQGNKGHAFHWKSLWLHSLATAMITREILTGTPEGADDDDTDYLVGLLHNVGKLLMGYAFPEELTIICATRLNTSAEVAQLERELIGWDHAQIGAYFLQRHQLSEEITHAVRHHIAPAEAPSHQMFAAAVQIADHVATHAGFACGFELTTPIGGEGWVELEGWSILYGRDSDVGRIALASLSNTAQRLPTMLGGMF